MLSIAEKILEWEYLGRQVISVPKENSKTVSTKLEIVNANATEEGNTNSKAVYKNIEKDTDLEYCLNGNNLKENIIVKEKSANYRYIFALKTKGLKLHLSENNENLELYSENKKEDGSVEKKVEFTIPSPYMYDANGSMSDEVYYELEPFENGNYTFAVIADENWINASARVFPVTIDPQMKNTKNIQKLTEKLKWI